MTDDGDLVPLTTNRDSPIPAVHLHDGWILIMTNEQKAWLDAHPEYQPLGVVGGHIRYTSRGTLELDGTFVPVNADHPLRQDGGRFGVGKREVRDPANPEPGVHTPDPRGYLKNWQEGGGGLPSKG